MVPTRELLGLGPEPKMAERLEVIEGVEVDYSSSELRQRVEAVPTKWATHNQVRFEGARYRCSWLASSGNIRALTDSKGR